MFINTDNLIVDIAEIEDRKYPYVIYKSDRGYISMIIGLKSEADGRKVEKMHLHAYLGINYMEPSMPSGIEDILNKCPEKNEFKKAFDEVGYWIGFGGINSDNYILDAYYPFLSRKIIDDVILKCFDEAGFESETGDLSDMKMTMKNCYKSLWEMDGPIPRFDSILNINTKVLTATDTESFRNKMNQG